ncbi:alpha-N-acetylgalactosaminide alpha-2,6-sialyltransferase 5-like [Branchiostoma floridae x Branchiostoma japonicum]
MMSSCSNYKDKTPILIGLVVGFTLFNFVYFPAYLYVVEVKPQPLCHAARRSRETEVPTNMPNTTAGPTESPGPVHPVPFHTWSSNPLNGYVNVLTLKEDLRLRCSVCALVSTSGHVLNCAAGAEIDQAECVIRMNHSPVNGFEKHVGTRTTVRVATHTSFNDATNEITQIISQANRSKLVVWGPDDTMRIDGKGQTYNNLFKLAKDSKDVEFYMLTSRRMFYTDRLFENETGIQRHVKNGMLWLSTGWFTMVLATEMCDHIKVYGMSSAENCRDPTARQAAYHYFNDTIKHAGTECEEYYGMEKKAKDAHRFFAEKKVFKTWSKYHKITFHCPSWIPKT